MSEAAVLGVDRAQLERELPGWLATRRWFGGKGEPGLTARLLRATPLPGADGLALGAVAAETDRSVATYALPLELDGDGLIDAFEQPRFVRWVIERMADGARVADGEGELRFEAFPGFDVAPDAPPRWLTAEQSNSSVVLGGRAVLKLLRKQATGTHPELEMVRHLTAQGFANVPPMLGAATRMEAGEPTLVMLLQRFVLNRGDGWSWTLDALAGAGDYRPFASGLGRRLAEMHAALARPVDDEAFAPEPLDRNGAAALGERVAAQVAHALALIDAPGLNRDALAARIREAAERARGQCRTRIHGDLHLGQLLVTGDDVMFIDFEGEPTRPLAERRAKDLPLRDVAGVLRSFDYAEAKAGKTGNGFRETAEAAFLAGYAAEPSPLLDLFLLEKAAYEVAYEAANRPDWLEVPARGLRRIAAHLLEAA